MVLSKLVLAFALVGLLSVSEGRRHYKKFPYSRTREIERTRFGGRRDDLDYDEEDGPPFVPEDERSDERLASELSMLEVHRDGRQFIVERTPDDIRYLRYIYENIDRDVNPGRRGDGRRDDGRGGDRDGDGERRLTDLGDNELTITLPAIYSFAKHTGRILITKAGTSTKSVCTGILIGTKYVLTAAHCLHEGDGGDWFEEFDFYPRQTATNSPTGINWNRARVFTGWSQNDNRGCNNREYDIGIIELDSSPGLGSTAWGWSNAIEVDDGMGLYGYKNGGKAMVKTWGHISELETEAFKSDDTSCYGGQSGSGIYVEDGSTAINGVHVSSCATRNRHCRITSWKKASFDDFMS